MNTLETYLKTKSGEYFSLYENVKQAAQNIWHEARLGWYTDHGSGHSFRIISLLDQICGDMLANKQPNGLRHDEVFLLLAASWLHDIGMQDLTELNKKSVDQQTETEWEMVRKRHPQRAYEIISSYSDGSPENNPFYLGLNTNKNVFPLLSLICKGHGSNYYEEVTEKLNKRRWNIEGRGEPVRGALLTSLLLLADELDLHGNRAIWKKNYPLSNVSELHYYRHHFVNHVEIVKLNNVERQIRITMAFPEAALDNIAKDLQNWLGRKLKFELTRTEEHIRDGFHGSFQWTKLQEPVVFITETAEFNEKKMPQKQVIALLRREVNQVLDWKMAANLVQERFSKRKGGVVLIRGGADFGNTQFFNHLSLLLNCQKDDTQPTQHIVSIDFLQGNICGSIERIATYIYNSLFDFGLTCEPAEAMNALLEKANVSDIFCVIFLQNYDQALPREWDDFSALLLTAKFSEHFFFIINTNEQIHGVDCFELPAEFSEKDMICYFENQGHYGDKAKQKAITLKKLKESHKLNAKAVLTTANILIGDGL